MQFKRAVMSLLVIAICCLLLAARAAHAQAPNAIVTPLPPRMLRGNPVGGMRGSTSSGSAASQTSSPPTAPPDWVTPSCVAWWKAWIERKPATTAERAKEVAACTWQNSGCADFYPKYSKRELPDTPQNVDRAGACFSISPWDASGCPQLIQRLKERAPGIPMTVGEREEFVVCAERNPRNRQTFTGPPRGGWSPGKAYPPSYK
jgi:hypothetical protein